MADQTPKQYFVHMQILDNHPHTNGYREFIRRLHEDFANMLIQDPLKTIESLKALQDMYKEKFPRLRFSGWRDTQINPDGTKTLIYTISDSIVLYFNEVKNVRPRYHVQMPDWWMAEQYPKWPLLTMEEKRELVHSELTKVEEFLSPKDKMPLVIITTFKEKYKGWEINTIDFVSMIGKEVSNG